MIEILFIKPKTKQFLETASRNISTLLNIDIDELRYSDNAPGGCYKLGRALGLELTLQEADSIDFPDYDFEFVLQPEFSEDAVDSHILRGLADLIAKYLARNDMKIARPLSPKAGSARVEY
jgi:hypothetical protein